MFGGSESGSSSDFGADVLTLSVSAVPPQSHILGILNKIQDIMQLLRTNNQKISIYRIPLIPFPPFLFLSAVPVS